MINTHHISSRFTALLFVFSLLFTTQLHAQSWWGGEGPDEIIAGTPEAGLYWLFLSTGTHGVTASSYNMFLLSASYWCDALVTQSGSFTVPGQGVFGYSFEGGTYSTTYREVFEINSNVSPSDGDLGVILQGDNFAGSAETTASSVSYAGVSADMIQRGLFYTTQ